VIAQQMRAMQEIFREQLRALGTAPEAVARPAAAPIPAPVPQPAPDAVPAPAMQRSAEAQPAPQTFRVGRAPAVAHADLTDAQLDFARDLARRYADRFPGSKAHTQEHRAVHADPRSAAGFRQDWKDMVFPVVAAKAKGAYIEDIDGNRFVDLINGFGQTAFGHSPAFVTKAVSEQMEKGFPIGPQADLAGPVAERFAAMTGNERVTFCNTGSEAVMAAMRLARAVTGREKIVVFANDYHGQFDEVLVKARARCGAPDALPIAPGIPRSGLANMAVLDYGAPSSLDWIRSNINDIAGVVVEPVQSRHPAHRPVEFVRDLRAVTEAGGAALVMDEVVTGFRTGPKGMQGIWGIEADMATYGKVVGGGMPVGVLGGKRRFMDALDGGMWRYGDDSQPETAPTFFAGTFVRHPLVLAAVNAVLDHLEAEGDALWTRAAERSAALAAELRAMMIARGLPDLVEDYSSWQILKTSEQDPRATLLFPLMRMRGVHVMDGFAGFLTTVHGAAECRAVTDAFADALDELQANGILLGDAEAVAAPRPADVPSQAVPLTESQREIWMTHQLGDMPAASFNESISIRLDGALDTAALERAVGDLVARHDALRLRFARSGAHFDVMPAAAPEIHMLDVSAEPDPQAALRRFLEEDAARPIRITEEPPLRFALVRLEAETADLVLTLHHIVCDGWSLSILFEELAELYAAHAEGRAPRLNPAPSFAAFAAAQAERTPQKDVMDYWRAQYETIPDLPDLPTDRARPKQRAWAGDSVTVWFDAERTQAVQKAGARHGATLFATLFAGLQITLGRLSGSADVVLGVPTAGQTLQEAQDLVGHCVNFLPLRAAFDPSEPVSAHLKRVRDAVLDGFEHRDYTFGTLLRDLDVPRSLDRLPFTEVEFNLERALDPVESAGVTLSLGVNPKAAVNFDLFFNVSEGAEGLRIDVAYKSELFDRETVERWIGHFAIVLEALAEDTGRKIAALPLMTAEAQATLDAGRNATARAFGERALPALVAEQVAERPEATALSDAAMSLTYAELDRRSDAIAAYLQRALPEAPTRVAVALPRSVDLPAALLGVLKAGHAFVPLDTAQPEARLRTILQAAEAAALLTDDPASAGFAAGLDLARLSLSSVGKVDTPRPVAEDPDRTAYVIFTSGSTGTPKGVEITMRAMVNFVQSMAEAPGFTAGDRLLAVTTVSFDIAVLEMFLPLIAGGETWIATRDEVLDGFALAERLKGGGFTHLQSTPTLLEMLLEAGFQPSAGLRILAGGEPIGPELAERLMAQGSELWNMYGPTETTVWSAVKRLAPGMPITIGAPIANTELHVLDDRDQLVPVGVVGELNIGGLGLAKGYYGRPDLTEAAFAQVEIAGTIRRLYRTGDLAVRLADGEIRVLGRKDTQIKLRGFRIELGEIETRLRALPQVATSAVTLKTRANGDRQLVGYIVAAEGESPEPRDLAAALSDQLPDYMVPQAWVALSALPLTANGKLDRKALPDPEGAAPVEPLRPVEAPVTAMERQLATIWSEVLGIAEIPVTETVYALGADSLAVFRIAARMLDQGLDLEARDLLAHPSIRALAAFADARGSAEARRPSLRGFRNGAMRGRAQAS
jgi:amino acid adenylation domain-containing protein